MTDRRQDPGQEATAFLDHVREEGLDYTAANRRFTAPARGVCFSPRSTRRHCQPVTPGWSMARWLRSAMRAPGVEPASWPRWSARTGRRGKGSGAPAVARRGHSSARGVRGRCTTAAPVSDVGDRSCGPGRSEAPTTCPRVATHAGLLRILHPATSPRCPRRAPTRWRCAKLAKVEGRSELDVLADLGGCLYAVGAGAFGRPA